MLIVAAGLSYASVVDNLKVTGRHEVKGDTVLVGWNGFKIEGNFTGTKLGFQMKGPGQDFNVWIDQKPVKYADTSRKYLTPESSGLVWIDTNLQDGTHSFALQKRNEGGITAFWGVALSESGGLLAPMASSSRRVEFFGDSYSAGYGLESPTRDCSGADIRRYSNSSITFPVLYANMQNADLHLQAVSGLGIVRNYGGAQIAPMPTYVPLAQPQLGSSAYDLSSWKPKVVVVSLGTNDFSTLVKTDELWGNANNLKTAYKMEYHRLLDTLRQVYGGVVFILVQQSNYAAFSAALNEVYAEERAAGYNNIYKVLFGNLNMSACQWHADIADHEHIATRLSAMTDSLNLWNAPEDPYLGVAVPARVLPGTNLLWVGSTLYLPDGVWDLDLFDALGRPLLSRAGLTRSVDLAIHFENGARYFRLYNGKKSFTGHFPQ